MKKILVKRQDGGVSVIIPTNEATPELILRDVLAVPGYVSHREIEDSDLPTSRDFRNAWVDSGESINHDMTKANDIKRDQFRQLRKPLFETLDVAYMKSDEIGDTNAKIVISEKKQALRDVTIFDDINDIETLKNYMPQILVS